MNMIETLEDRVCLSSSHHAVPDPGGSLSAAQNLKTLSSPKTIKGSLSAKDTNNYYKFKTSGRGNFNLSLTGLKSNADVEIYDSSGNLLDRASNAGTSNESISRELPAGTYAVRVTGSSATNYRLRLQADANWGSIKFDGQRVEVGLVFANGSTAPIRKTDTWVTLHGYGSSPQGLAISHLGNALQGASGQVLALDWSEVGSKTDIVGAAEWLPTIAKWASSKLKSWGLSGSRLNLAGHSMGGWLADQVAGKIKGGVNRILAIDPATDPTGFFHPVNYAKHSRYSLGFIASSFSTESAAATADSAFHVEGIGDFNSIVTHSLVVDVVANMIENNTAGSPDNISKLFSLSRLSPKVHQPWKSNAYSGGFEGVLTAENLEPSVLTYKTKSGEVTVNA